MGHQRVVDSLTKQLDTTKAELAQYKNNDFVSQTVVAEYEENDLQKMIDLTAMTRTITIDRSTLNDEIKDKLQHNKRRSDSIGATDSMSNQSQEQMFEDAMYREFELKMEQKELEHQREIDELKRQLIGQYESKQDEEMNALSLLSAKNRNSV